MSPQQDKFHDTMCANTEKYAESKQLFVRKFQGFWTITHFGPTEWSKENEFSLDTFSHSVVLWEASLVDTMDPTTVLPTYTDWRR